MSLRFLSLLMVVATGVAIAQDTDQQTRINEPQGFLSMVSNLPVEKIGPDDLLGVMVYDSPTLTRTVRVEADGNIRLPMLQEHVHASGLYPSELEVAVAKALVAENVLVDPIVSVSVVEYRSRPITVVGAVKMPITFEATGKMTLLGAISQAQGFSDTASQMILVTRPAEDKNAAPLVMRIPRQALISGQDPSLNISLQGGEEIRVPEAGQVYVVGCVKKPGSYYINDGQESSVLKAISVSQGLDSFSSRKAYIYRPDDATGSRKEIPFDLKKIMGRKAPDIALMANDILYIPTVTGAKAGVKVLEETVAVGAALGAATIYVVH